jgi:hypothetical protein
MIFRQSDEVGVGVIWHYFDIIKEPIFCQVGSCLWIFHAITAFEISRYKSNEV